MKSPVDRATSITFAGRIGVARRDITPPVGIHARNWGAATHETAEGIHRPLLATAMAICGENDPQPLVFISVDLGWFKSPTDELLLRQPVLAALQLDPARLLICLSHTHAGPSICIDDRDQPGGALVAPYVQRVAQALVEAAAEAIANAADATIDWRYGLCNLAANRDLPDPADRSAHIVGYNPDVNGDSTLLVGHVANTDGETIAAIVNYACHPTTLAWENKLISPDYIGSMRELVERETGGLVLFIQGASGDLAPAEQYTADVDVADRNGRQLGHAVLGTLLAMPQPRQRLAYTGVVESGARLAVWRQRPGDVAEDLHAKQLNIALPLKKLPTLAEIDGDISKCNDNYQRERLKRKRRLVQFVGPGKTCDMPLWVWRIGHAIIVAHPNEAYSDWQRCLRERWPDRHIVVANLTNGSCGYVIPQALCQAGLYAYWQSPFERGSFEITEESTQEAIANILLQSSIK